MPLPRDVDASIVLGGNLARPPSPRRGARSRGRARPRRRPLPVMPVVCSADAPISPTDSETIEPAPSTGIGTSGKRSSPIPVSSATRAQHRGRAGDAHARARDRRPRARRARGCARAAGRRHRGRRGGSSDHAQLAALARAGTQALRGAARPSAAPSGRSKRARERAARPAGARLSCAAAAPAEQRTRTSSAAEQRSGGEGGIRTPGRLRACGFQDRRLRPLGHLSTIQRPHPQPPRAPRARPTAPPSDLVEWPNPATRRKKRPHVLDLRFIIENLDAVRANCAKRNVPVDLDRLVRAGRAAPRADRRAAVGTGAAQRARARDRRAASRATTSATLGKELKEREATLEGELAGVRDELTALHVLVPNMTHPDVPIGDDGRAEPRAARGRRAARVRLHAARPRRARGQARPDRLRVRREGDGPEVLLPEERDGAARAGAGALLARPAAQARLHAVPDAGPRARRDRGRARLQPARRRDEHLLDRRHGPGARRHGRDHARRHPPGRDPRRRRGCRCATAGCRTASASRAARTGAPRAGSTACTSSPRWRCSRSRGPRSPRRCTRSWSRSRKRSTARSRSRSASSTSAPATSAGPRTASSTSRRG